MNEQLPEAFWDLDGGKLPKCPLCMREFCTPIDEGFCCTKCGSVWRARTTKIIGDDVHGVDTKDGGLVTLTPAGMVKKVEDQTVPQAIRGGNKMAGQDMVNHPPHYNFGKYEVLDVIEDWQLEYQEGNVVKYIARAKHKGNRLQDLKKAQFYLNRAIAKVEQDKDLAPTVAKDSLK
jgi:uncharacterized Zn ribbon protein